jgi:hypothetical protein
MDEMRRATALNEKKRAQKSQTQQFSISQN